jgi:hypothetical protein
MPVAVIETVGGPLGTGGAGVLTGGVGVVTVTTPLPEQAAIDVKERKKYKRSTASPEVRRSGQTQAAKEDRCRWRDRPRRAYHTVARLTLPERRDRID